MNLCFFAVLLALRGSAGSAHASPDQPEQVPVIDMKPRLAGLLALDDGQGHRVVLDPKDLDVAFYGDAHDLWRLQVFSSSSEGATAFEITALDFRARNRNTSVAFRDGAYRMDCQDYSRPLTALPAASARAYLDSVTFHEHRWRRNALALFRDEYGVYYYVDRATGDDLDADNRVYVGWRGQMLRAPMTLIASDSLGRVYSAANGARRLVQTGDQARYVEGAVERVLYALDLTEDAPFVYGPFGVYGDAPQGTPCDVLLPR